MVVRNSNTPCAHLCTPTHILHQHDIVYRIEKKNGVGLATSCYFSRFKQNRDQKMDQETAKVMDRNNRDDSLGEFVI